MYKLLSYTYWKCLIIQIKSKILILKKQDLTEEDWSIDEYGDVYFRIGEKDQFLKSLNINSDSCDFDAQFDLKDYATGVTAIHTSTKTKEYCNDFNNIRENKKCAEMKLRKSLEINM